MAKYKVGDKVRVKADIKEDVSYKMEDSSWKDCAVPRMVKFAGKIVTIKRVGYKYSIEEDNGYYTWTDGMFECLADNHKIVINTDGKTTTASMYDGKELIKKAEAKCSPDDKFDFMVGAKLAMERLEEPKKPVNPFKVGDFVKITGDKHEMWHDLPNGSVGRIKKADHDNACYVDGFTSDGLRLEQWVGVEDLEKI